MHDERTDPSMYYSTEPWFVRHRLYPERTKTFVFGFVFVFVLAHEQPITMAKHGRVHEEAVYESNMPIESCIESNRVGLPITPIPDCFFGTFAARIF